MIVAQWQVAADLRTKPIGQEPIGQSACHKPAFRLLGELHSPYHFYYSARKLLFILPSHGRAESTCGWLDTEMVKQPTDVTHPIHVLTGPDVE